MGDPTDLAPQDHVTAEDLQWAEREMRRLRGILTQTTDMSGISEGRAGAGTITPDILGWFSWVRELSKHDSIPSEIEKDFISYTAFVLEMIRFHQRPGSPLPGDEQTDPEWDQEELIYKYKDGVPGTDPDTIKQRMASVGALIITVSRMDDAPRANLLREVYGPEAKALEERGLPPSDRFPVIAAPSLSPGLVPVSESGSQPLEALAYALRWVRAGLGNCAVTMRLDGGNALLENDHPISVLVEVLEEISSDLSEGGQKLASNLRKHDTYAKVLQRKSERAAALLGAILQTINDDGLSNTPGFGFLDVEALQGLLEAAAEVFQSLSRMDVPRQMAVALMAEVGEQMGYVKNVGQSLVIDLPRVREEAGEEDPKNVTYRGVNLGDYIWGNKIKSGVLKHDPTPNMGIIFWTSRLLSEGRSWKDVQTYVSDELSPQHAQILRQLYEDPLAVYTAADEEMRAQSGEHYVEPSNRMRESLQSAIANLRLVEGKLRLKFGGPEVHER